MQTTHEHEALRTTIRRFIADEVEPNVDEWERIGAFPAHEVFRRMVQLELTGISKPAAYGGLALDFSSEVLVAEDLDTAVSAHCPWHSACRPAWARRRWPGLAVMPCAENSWLQ